MALSFPGLYRHFVKAGHFQKRFEGINKKFDDDGNVVQSLTKVQDKCNTRHQAKTAIATQRRS
jgi:hypothetical protein